MGGVTPPVGGGSVWNAIYIEIFEEEGHTS